MNNVYTSSALSKYTRNEYAKYKYLPTVVQLLYSKETPNLGSYPNHCTAIVTSELISCDILTVQCHGRSIMCPILCVLYCVTIVLNHGTLQCSLGL